MKAHRPHGIAPTTLEANVLKIRHFVRRAEQPDHGIDVLVTKPELVKTGLDLLEFPTIVFC